MKLLRLSWDFLFGALLIGGAPICVMAVTVLLADLYQWTFQVIISEGVSLSIFGAMFMTAVAALAYAIRFRLHRRLLPKGVLGLEVLLGIVGAFCLFCFYGLLMYSTIG